MTAMSADRPQISVVIPLLNEEESLQELHDWIVSVMVQNAYTYELILIDDGSTDASWEVIRRLSTANSCVSGIRFRRNYGKSAGLNVGFQKSKGHVVFTMDADLQDSPEEIPAMYSMVVDEGYDIVSGWKKKRFDPISKTIPTKLYNFVTSAISGVRLHDMNCGLKAYKSQVVKSIEVYGEMHRYIPVIAKWAGFKKIGEKVVRHQARKYGVSKFGLSRFVYGPLDLLSIMFMGKFGKRPMHFFGVWGSVIMLAGICLLGWLSLSKLFFQTVGIADRPAFYLGILMVIVGVQMFIAGFLGELISRSAPERNTYMVSEEL
ncbi:MAG: glycosyltransferase family 2 protein [Saprospiraceae bacterium]|jgi:glycosyltransferase involved in cell wall biosynthesis|nr:glycosyltransferase family 2 protein [Saprospiraceae bacterium]